MKREFTLVEGLIALTFPIRIWALAIFLRWGFTDIEKDIVMDTLREEKRREGKG